MKYDFKYTSTKVPICSSGGSGSEFFGFGFIGFDLYAEFRVFTGSGLSIKLHYGFGFGSSGFRVLFFL